MKVKRHKGRKPIELLNDYLDHIKTLKVQRAVPVQPRSLVELDDGTATSYQYDRS